MFKYFFFAILLGVDECRKVGPIGSKRKYKVYDDVICKTAYDIDNFCVQN